MGRILRFHIRILMWHLQITPNWEFTLQYNDYHKCLKHGWYEVYEAKNLLKIRKHFDIRNTN